jgi:hypothetical protein
MCQKEFVQHPTHKRRICNNCKNYLQNEKYYQNVEQRRKYKRKWRKDNQDKIANWPSEQACPKLLNRIRQRIKSKPSYIVKKLKCDLTIEQLKILWKRDNAHKLKWASIDRIDNNGDYTFNNCRFIEIGENARRQNSKPIAMCDNKMNIIRTFRSASEAHRKTGINDSSIYWCLNSTRGTEYAGGYKWKRI